MGILITTILFSFAHPFSLKLKIYCMAVEFMGGFVMGGNVFPLEKKR